MRNHSLFIKPRSRSSKTASQFLQNPPEKTSRISERSKFCSSPINPPPPLAAFDWLSAIFSVMTSTVSPDSSQKGNNYRNQTDDLSETTVEKSGCSEIYMYRVWKFQLVMDFPKIFVRFSDNLLSLRYFVMILFF